jgi:hypothetical protein
LYPLRSDVLAAWAIGVVVGEAGVEDDHNSNLLFRTIFATYPLLSVGAVGLH